MKNKLVILFSFFIFSKAYSQEFSSYYSYLLNRVNINPAYVGNASFITANLNSRTQFTNVPNNSRNIHFNIDAPLFVDQGIGVKVINDVRGVFNLTRVDAAYSHRVELDKDLSLRFGLSIGALNRQINSFNLREESDLFASGDPSLFSQSNNFTRFVTGAGIVLNWKEVELGLSSPHLIENSENLSEFLFSNLSYNYALDKDWTLKPTIIYQNVPITQNILDVLFQASWKDKLSATAGISTNNRLKAGVGLNLKVIQINYLYEYSTGDLNDLSPNTHEVMLTLAIKRKPKRLGHSVMARELDAIISDVNHLVEDETNYDKEYIQQKIIEMHEALDKILDENTEKNAEKVADKLKIIEKQFNFLLKKYNI